MNNRIHSENRRASLAHRLALAPYSVWAVIFVAVPLVFVAYYAFTDESFRFTTENLTKFFTAVSTITDDSGAAREVHTYLLIFWRSVKLAVISTAICLLMGYPIAYIIARAAPRTQKTIITLIMIPMWMNFLIRTYAWMTILQDSGLLNMLFSALHLGQAHIIGTEGAVVVGMVYDYFPYMILPIYSVMAKMDTRLIEAARDLGCNSLGVLRRVIFPLSLPGGCRPPPASRWCSSRRSAPFISRRNSATASSSLSATRSRGSTWPITCTLPPPSPSSSC